MSSTDTDIPEVALRLAEQCGPASAIAFMRACGLDLAAERGRIAEVKARRQALMIKAKQGPSLQISHEQPTDGEPVPLMIIRSNHGSVP